MQPHEHRVVDEFNELSLKIGNLKNFFTTSRFSELDEVDQLLLLVQKDQMMAYELTLQRRIDRF